MKTPGSFKTQLAKSCVYSSNLGKDLARASLAEIEKQKFLALNSAEILSSLHGGLCEKCIFIKSEPAVKAAVTVLSLPQTTFHTSPLINDAVAGAIKKPVVPQHKTFTELSIAPKAAARCKSCNTELTKRIMIELSDRGTATTEIGCHSKVRLKDGEKGIMKLLANDANQLSIVVICDKTTEVFTGNSF